MHNNRKIGVEVIMNKKKICVLLTAAIMFGNFTLPQLPVSVKADEVKAAGDSVSPLGTVENCCFR